VPCSPTTNTIVSYAWGFGDGGAAMGRVASHSYSAPGAYTVTLTVTNDGGKFASVSTNITVAASALPTPVFVFSPNAPSPGQVVQFNASASTAVAGHSIVGYVWNFGDGATGSGQLASHPYAAIGSYAVTLTVTDDAGQSATVNQSVNVQVPTPPAPATPPAAKFTSSPASPHTPPVTVFFDGSGSTTSNGAAINNYHWNFGDGTIISGPPAGVAPGGGTFQAPNHVYATTGGFNVNLTVTDTNNLSGSATGTVTVVP
jgi:PKD repeat protein